MPAADLLRRFHRARDAHDRAALFAPDGEVGLHGPTEASARGPAAIEALFRGHGPDDRLVLGPPTAQPDGVVSALYGWAGDPERVAGELWLVPAGDRIGRLDLYALPAPTLPLDRRSVRAVLVAPGPRILLLRCAEPGKPGSWWITPGGGVQPGEDDLAALGRELAEEIGHVPEALGPCVWTRTHTFVWRDAVLRQHERFHLVALDRAVAPAPTAPDDGQDVHRWWALDELEASDEVFAPRRLAALVRALLRDGAPPEPVDAGV